VTYNFEGRIHKCVCFDNNSDGLVFISNYVCIFISNYVYINNAIKLDFKLLDEFSLTNFLNPD